MADIRQTNSNGGEVAMTVTAGDLARMTTNGQDAGEGKLVVAAFDPYEPGGVKSVHQDGAACTLVNGTSPGHRAAIIDLLTGGQATGTLTAAYWKGPGKTQDRALVLQREVAR